MFGLPNAKRVKRSKLFSTASLSEDETDNANKSTATEYEATTKSSNLSTSEVKPEDTESSRHKSNRIPASHQDDEIQVDYGFEYEYVDKTDTAQAPDPTTKPQDSNEAQVYAFNLFAPTPKPRSNTDDHNPSPTQPTQITLRPQSPPITSLLPTSQSITSGRILTPRPLSHYFTAHLAPPTLHALRAQYHQSAISGESLLSSPPTPWPGTRLPWRIIHVPRHKLTLRDPTLSNSTKTAASAHPSSTSLSLSAPTPIPKPHSRPRPSKHRRIKLRERTKSHAALQLASQQAAETEREKRTRRNREKKVKRKTREKEKKATVAKERVEGEVEAGNGNGNGNGDESGRGGMQGKDGRCEADEAGLHRHGDGGSGSGSSDGKSGDDINMVDSRDAIGVAQ